MKIENLRDTLGQPNRITILCYAFLLEIEFTIIFIYQTFILRRKLNEMKEQHQIHNHECDSPKISLD